MPAAMVDSTGLLGMALAFRAAAGELSMPDDAEQKSVKTKPWTLIDTEKPKTCAERVVNLEKKIALLEKELTRVRINTKRRKELTEEALKAKRVVDDGIEADDLLARMNHFKKKKKLSPKPEHG